MNNKCTVCSETFSETSRILTVRDLKVHHPKECATPDLMYTFAAHEHSLALVESRKERGSQESLVRLNLAKRFLLDAEAARMPARRYAAGDE